MRPFIGWSATVVITLGRSRMESSCPLLSSPTGNDPAFPKLTLIAHSHTGGLGASFGSAITESLLSEKAIRLSRNTVPPGSNCYRFWHGKGLLVWKPPNLQRTKICRLLSMPVRKILLCWLRKPVAVQEIFKTLRGDRACKALSLGEVAAAGRLRIAGFGEGTPQQDSDGTECAKCEIWHLGRILLSAAPSLPLTIQRTFFRQKTRYKFVNFL